MAMILLLVSIAQVLRRDPSQMGLLSDCGAETPCEEPGSAGENLSLRETLRTRQFRIICAVNLMVVFCLMIIMVHIVPHAQDLGASATKAASVIATIGGVSMAGRFITGIAIDRFGSRRVMIVCFILLITGLLWLQVATKIWMLFLFAVIYGIAHGGFFTAISPIVAEFFGITAHGVLFGIVAFGGTVGGAIGPILAGYIFDVTAGYGPALWICTVISAFGLLLISLLKPIQNSKS